MATLHIEHAVTDFPTWKAAFDRFSEKRNGAGVTGHRVYQPHGDPKYVLLQLEFGTVEQALAFQRFLETSVWRNVADSPALSGAPRSLVLVDAPEQ